MKSVKVKKLMIPLSQYATVSADATLLDAVLALQKSHAAFDRTKYRHRAILVLDNNNQVIGKISQLDALKALEPKYQEFQDSEISGTYRHFSEVFLKSMHEEHRLFDQSLNGVRSRAAKLKAGEVMQSPSQGEFLSEDATLDEALHMLVVGHHQSLLVTRGRRIVGILRLTDVFTAVFQISFFE